MSTDARSIAARYARALFDLARARNIVDTVQDDLAALALLLDSSKELRAMVAHPHLPEKRVEASMQALFGKQAAPLTLQFLRFLIKRRRLPLLPDVIPLFDAMYDAHLGRQKADVVSAVPLSGPQREQLNVRLKRRIGHSIMARYSEDARLIGGFRVHIGDTIHDYSVATMLQTFKQKLLNA